MPGLAALTHRKNTDDDVIPTTWITPRAPYGAFGERQTSAGVLGICFMFPVGLVGLILSEIPSDYATPTGAIMDLSP